MTSLESSFFGFYKLPAGNFHYLSHLQTLPLWQDIYQIENGDQAVGGPNGLANLQATQLANRTLFLYNLIKEIIQYLNINNPDGSIPLKVSQSDTLPNDNSVWLAYTSKINNTKYPVTAAFDDDTVQLFDGNTFVDVDSSTFALSEDSHQPNISLPPDTLDSTLDPDAVDLATVDSNMSIDDIKSLFPANISSLLGG